MRGATDQNLQFGRYEFLRRLAVGGMGEIFLARQVGIEGFSRLVVVKRIRPEVARDRHRVDLFVGEARNAANLAHANIAQVYEFGREQGELYIALEYVRGANLAELRTRSRMLGVTIPRPVVAHLACEVLSGLDFAHAARDAHGRPLGLVHQDISPHNILVSCDGDVKITDFGIARASLRCDQQSPVMGGKLRYMSPEQLDGRVVDHRADLFAVGVILWELGLDRDLFDGSLHDSEAGSTLDLRREVPAPSTIDPSFPAPLEAAIKSALARDPDQRVSSAAELRAVLRTYLASCGEAVHREDVGDLVSRLFPERTAEIDSGVTDVGDGSMALPLPNDATYAPGAILDDYEITGRIGEGGMGVVYAGINRTIGKKVAIKVLHPHLAVKEGLVARFLQEARVVNQVGHPNIVDIFAFGTLPDGSRYHVMELLSGESLRARIERCGRLPVDELLAVLDKVADAVDAAHDRGILHRDLKPDNIFITDSGETKVLDFGLAKVAQDPLAVTQTGAPMGTPHFMAPEQWRGGKLTVSADVFSLGVVAYQALTGTLPHPRASVIELARGTLDAVRLPSERGAPEAADEPIMRCMDPDPGRRYQSMSAAVAALRDALAIERRRRGWIRGGALALGGMCLVGATVASLILSGGGEREVDEPVTVTPTVERGPVEPTPTESIPRVADPGVAVGESGLDVDAPLLAVVADAMTRAGAVDWDAGLASVSVTGVQSDASIDFEGGGRIRVTFAGAEPGRGVVVTYGRAGRVRVAGGQEVVASPLPKGTQLPEPAEVISALDRAGCLHGAGSAPLLYEIAGRSGEAPAVTAEIGGESYRLTMSGARLATPQCRRRLAANSPPVPTPSPGPAPDGRVRNSPSSSDGDLPGDAAGDADDSSRGGESAGPRRVRISPKMRQYTEVNVVNDCRNQGKHARGHTDIEFRTDETGMVIRDSIKIPNADRAFHECFARHLGFLLFSRDPSSHLVIEFSLW